LCPFYRGILLAEVSTKGGFTVSFSSKMIQGLVLLPGFQKGRDIKASSGKGQGAVPSVLRVKQI
jgi:hypothetical protein